MTCMCLVSQYRENAREKQIEKNEYVWLGLVYLVDYNVANSRYLATGTLKGDNQRLQAIFLTFFQIFLISERVNIIFCKIFKIMHSKYRTDR